jgi:hypothetical protein
MLRHLLAIAVILTVATGCDNVAWGGIDVAIEAPGQAEGSPDAEGAEASEIETPPTPVGPILLAGTRQGSSLTLAPVGMLIDDVLSPLPAASDSAAHQATVGSLRPGSEWVLFASGARVGTATASAAARDAELCEADVTLTATPELIPAAAATERFLALPAEAAEGWPSQEYVRLDHTYDQRVASLSLSAAAVPRVSAAWPSGGMLGTRRDIQAFRPVGSDVTSIAASFVISDGLNTLAPASGAYALFLMFEERPAGFEETFLWYRPAAQGKAVPRFFQHLDWDGDGTDEVILEVFGEGRRGWVGLERGADQAWTVSYRSPCAHIMGAEGG